MFNSSQINQSGSLGICICQKINSSLSVHDLMWNVKLCSLCHSKINMHCVWHNTYNQYVISTLVNTPNDVYDHSFPPRRWCVLIERWLNMFLTIIGGAVLDYNFHCFTELLPWWVQSLTYILPQRLQVHGPRDDLIVVLHNLGIDWCVEWICLHRRGRRSKDETVEQ